MAYFPDKQKVQTELQESTTELDLSCDHITTCNFFDTNIAYVRDNTPREEWESDVSVFARPMPNQMPVMGKATLSLKTFFVPYRVISPQWHDFITRSPHVCPNTTTPIHISEMPYIQASEFQALIADTDISTVTTSNNWDFKDSNGVKYILKPFGRYVVKILNQLRYQIIMDDRAKQHIDGKRLLAFAKVWLDWYYGNQYMYVNSDYTSVEQIFKRDDITPYAITKNDIKNICKITQYCFYDPDYFTTQWDNPTSPNGVATSFGAIQMQDITITGLTPTGAMVDNTVSSGYNQYGTPAITGGSFGSAQAKSITQYALDSLKTITDYCRRYTMVGLRSIDRYLARFGVLLTTEKLQRSEFYGTQKTPMEFGAIYSQAETTQAKLGDYAGTSIINSDHGEHTHFKLEELKDYGTILQLFVIKPKIGYFQGIDRHNLVSDPESYFSGQFDQLGTQNTAAVELYISNDGTSAYGNASFLNQGWGFVPRNAHCKVALDNLTGDFRRKTINAAADVWHMFRIFDDNYFANNGDTHNFTFIQAFDAGQYLRIFNDTNADSGDHFQVILQFKVKARVHAKALYDGYDFEGEGKKIIMDGLGPKAN